MQAMTNPDDLVAEGTYYTLAWACDIAMALDIEAQSRYREIYGRDWEPIGAVTTRHTSLVPASHSQATTVVY